MKKIITACFILFFVPVAHAENRLVTKFSDVFENGSLRKVLTSACDEPGDDFITFSKTHLSEIRIEVGTPYVIPEDCNGNVSIEGSSEVDTILDAYYMESKGGTIPGDSCIFNVYADGNSIKNLSLINNSAGAGICLFGQDNSVEDSRLGRRKEDVTIFESNRYGIVISRAFGGKFPGMNGNGSYLTGNRVQFNTLDGVWADANELVFEGNEIFSNGRNGIFLRSRDSLIRSNTIAVNGGCGVNSSQKINPQPAECMNGGYSSGAGIWLKEGSVNNVIGGSSFENDKNIIQYNLKAGIIIEGGSQNTITHNRISKNYVTMLGIDLGNDGVTLNDWLDEDLGPNNLLNSVEHFQVFPLVQSLNGKDRYWTWGLGGDGIRLEVYEVSTLDTTRGLDFGGGNNFNMDVSVQNGQFEIMPLDSEFISGDRITTLLFDEYGNTSEFSRNIYVGPDDDLDGIPNFLESTNKNSDESYSMSADSDEDGLPDSIEDKNLNGVWDEDKFETAAYLADSDDDGVSDWVETHGDGVYHPGKDTDPLKRDTDLDGLDDGVEDKNGNGIWEAYLEETSPLHADSDLDGDTDGIDTCPHVSNKYQEAWYCQK